MNNKVDIGTIERTIVLVIALVNQVCAIMGWTPLDIAEADVYQSVTLIATIGASIWAWWKNNSFTQSALEADKLMHELKKGDANGRD